MLRLEAPFENASLGIAASVMEKPTELEKPGVTRAKDLSGPPKPASIILGGWDGGDSAALLPCIY